MKHAEPIRPVTKQGAAKFVDEAKPLAKKPLGPVTYTVSKGSDVFWSGKTGRPA